VWRTGNGAPPGNATRWAVTRWRTRGASPPTCVGSGWPYARIAQGPDVPGLGSQACLFDNLDKHRSDTVQRRDRRCDTAFLAGRDTFSTLLAICTVPHAHAVTHGVLTHGARFGHILSARDPRTAHVALRRAFCAVYCS